MLSQSDRPKVRQGGRINFIIMYQEHLTKILQLGSLKTKTVEEEAYHQFKYF